MADWGEAASDNHDLELLFRVARRLRPHADPRELVGDGYLGLRAARTRFDPTRGVPFEAFALRCIRWAMLDGLRRLKSRPLRACRPPDRDPLGRVEAEDLVSARLPGLRRRWRLAVQLYYLEGLSMRQIAEILGISVPRVSQLLRAALRQLGSSPVPPKQQPRGNGEPPRGR